MPHRAHFHEPIMVAGVMLTMLASHPLKLDSMCRGGR